jgi:hypothetical protein
MVGQGGSGATRGVDPAAALHRRAEAMRDLEDGRLPEAEARLDALLEGLRDAGPPTIQTIQVLTDRATVRRYANRWDDALADIDDAEQRARSMKEVPRRATLPPLLHLRAKLLLSRLELLGPDAAGASDILAAAGRITEELRTFAWVPWAADELESDIAYRSGEWDRAARLAVATATTLRQLGWEVGAARLQLRSGEAFIELEDLDAASTQLSAASDFFARRGPAPDLGATGLARAWLAQARGDTADAWALARQALDEIERQIRSFHVASEQRRFVLDKARYYDRAFAIALALPGNEGVVGAWTVAERAKSFYLCQLVANAQVELFDGVDVVSVRRLREMEQAFDTAEMRLAQLGDAPSAEHDEARERRDDLSRRRLELVETLMRANPRWAALRVPPPLDLEAEIAKLGPRWSALGYFWRRTGHGARALHIFTSVAGSAPAHVEVPWTPEDLAVLRAACVHLRGEEMPGEDIFAAVFPAALAEKILPAAVRDAFPADTSLLISTHEELRALPLHALPIDGEAVLIDRWPVQYLPTFALFPLRRGDAIPDRVLALGCVEGAFGGPPLPEVRDEVASVRAAWETERPGRITTAIIPDDGASPAAAGAPLERWSDYGVVHLACHGDFPKGRPFDASLMLGDEQIGPSDLFATRLRASLVALSACSLGRSEDNDAVPDPVVDEWAGLLLPLSYAGAESVLMSLWAADSATAQRVMTELHRALGAGAGPAVALQRAIAAVRSMPPSLWANWYLAGLPPQMGKEVPR